MHVLLLNWYEGPQVALHLLQGPQLLQRLVTTFKKDHIRVPLVRGRDLNKCFFLVIQTEHTPPSPHRQIIKLLIFYDLFSPLRHSGR